MRTSCLAPQIRHIVKTGPTITSYTNNIALRFRQVYSKRGISVNHAAFINGKWIEKSKSGKTFQVFNPATEELLCTLPDMGQEETKEAIQSAYDCFHSEDWSFHVKTGDYRSDLLRKLSKRVLDQKEEIASLITQECGKVKNDALGEVVYAASFLDWFADQSLRIEGDNIPAASKSTHRIITARQPVGVVGIITPFNFPLAMMTRKVGAALAAGCTCVVKPDADVPMTCLKFAELVQEAGFPSGCLNVVTSKEHTKDVGSELSQSELIRKLSFTGSTNVGKALYAQCSGTVKRISLELGGNAPYIVFNSADLEKAADQLIVCKFRCSGQTCVSANRVFVQDEIYDKFTKIFVDKVKNLKVGDPSKDDTIVGSLIRKAALDKVTAHVEDAKQKGAKVACGGQIFPDIKNCYYPTVLLDLTDDMKIFHEETFGPVAGIYKFSTEEEVIQRANNSPVGLAAYIWSTDMSQVWRVPEKIEAGMIGINTGLVSGFTTPFGGVKQSGLGREGSKYGLDEYLELKSIVFDIERTV